MKRPILRGVGFFLFWCSAWSLCLELSLQLAVVWAVIVCATFFHLYIARAMLHRRRSALLRIRPLGPALPWVAAASPVLFVFSDALSQTYSRLPFVEPDPGSVIDPYTKSAAGWLLMVLLVVVIAPVLEEFTFRGWLQRPLERRIGAAAAITVSAMLFAIIHGEPTWLLVYAVVGGLFGVAVRVTGSIWAGVILHAVHNAGVLIAKGINAATGRPLGEGIEFGAVGSVGALIGSATLLLYLAHRIRLSARFYGRRSRPGRTLLPRRGSGLAGASILQ